MGKKAAFATVLLFLIVADGVSASLWNFRKLVSSEPKDNSYTTVSPNPSPAPVFGEDSSKDKPGNKTPPPKPAEKDEGGKKKDEVKANEPSGTSETCDSSKGNSCKDTLSMVACVQAVDEVQKVMVILIQNKGDDNLKVSIKTSSLKELKEAFEVPKHHSEKTSISVTDAGTTVLLNAGHGDCTLQIDQPATKGDINDWIPSHTDLMTPIYGAYFLVFITVVALGVFACCKCRKRRHDEVPYQELEMGETWAETSINVESAEGWDQGWDDDWDDNKVVKSPGAHRPGSVSSNGLTARSPNRDGWEDWDDQTQKTLKIGESIILCEDQQQGR